MTKVAIVSSHKTLCGIAKYVSRLQAILQNHFIVDIVSLDVDLLKKTSDHEIFEGDRHIDLIIDTLKDYDVVNIHVENGLFGARSIDISRRLRRLFEISNPVCITIHWLSSKPSFRFQEFFGDVFSFNFNRLYRYFRQKYNYNLVGSSLYGQHLKAQQERKFVSLITHTKSDRSRLQAEFGLKHVYDHPVSYLSSDEITLVQNRASRSSFPGLASLPDSAKLYGLFGFLAPYKGFEVAIRALNSLGKDHHLAIFGDLAPGQQDTSYREMLRREAAQFDGRVHFCGGQSEALFLDAISLCDAVLMPYREVGLSASGPASLALELGKRVIASDISAFKSLSDYFPGQLHFFSEGDSKDLALQIENKQGSISGFHSQIPSAESNIALYKNIFELAANKSNIHV